VTAFYSDIFKHVVILPYIKAQKEMEYVNQQTLSIVSMKYVFFWVFPRRLSANSRRFGTAYLFYLQRQVN
jgi:hypothetical protein